LLVDANLAEQMFSFGFNGEFTDFNDKWFYGKFTDFNDEWFRTKGSLIVSTMLFNAIYPLIEFTIFYALRLIFRLKDSSCTLNKYKTKSKSIQGYMDIHNGPKFEMYFKYSSILNIVFVTFMYGYGIPVLFPIALLSFIIIFIVEKAQLYYSNQAPPFYDERLPQKVFSIMKWAPSFYLGFGYWMASSKQLLSNDFLTPISWTNEPK
jgi:hypothetical protein